ncbi:MAG: electron transfer flavoprotein subunit alpha/FixB family protein [Armatimonadota bacterium]|nr:electron transfer flavoprotein subunit alpha/FixB family protein [Armatimonadota bacterium]
MAGICVVASALDGALSRGSLELVTAARALEGSGEGGIAAALLGSGPHLAEAAGTLQQHGVAAIYRCDHPLLTSGQTDAALIATEQIVRRAQPGIVLVSADTVGRELGPRLAARMGAALVTEAVDVAVEGGALLVRRQVYGGRAMATLAVAKRPAVLTVKPRALDVPEPRPSTATVEEVPVAIDGATLGARVREVRREQAEVGLEDAQIVVGGGRGLGGPEGFKVLQQLAEVLGGAVGSSRPPADAGWVPVSWQIGQTGKTIRPALYIAVGISGATQHVAGVAGARTIVAINRDPDAPIFSVAHLGIVGDYREVVPALIAKVKELRGR